MEPIVDVLGTGRSVDGRTFTAGVVPDSLQAGLVIALSADEDDYLGLVLSVSSGSEEDRAVGVVLGALEPDGTLAKGRRSPFPHARARVLGAEQVAGLQASMRATMEIGRWDMAGSSAQLKLVPKAFNRHTFLCGQSGSGKTYALGVILEQLILQTQLPMIVLDPNGDFVHLAQGRPDAPTGPVQRLADAGIQVTGTPENPLILRFTDLPRPVQAAVLELDPVRDRLEYGTWLDLEAGPRVTTGLAALVQELLEGPEEQRALAQRARNLGIADWSIWAQGKPVQPPGAPPRVEVRDLSGFEHPAETLVAGIDVVERLWAERASRRPTLLVIDEAHNLCPAEPQSPLQKLLVERLIQIAAEGRKYGMWLLLSTQRPSKVHPQVLSQCDNLVLMRMNSPLDLADLGRLFGFAPEAMLQASPHFSQGELLVAGAFTPVPSFGRVGPRLSVEGGSDVSVPLN